MEGYIKLHRSVLDNPICTKSEYFHLWCILLLLANHKDNEFIYRNEKMICKTGQLITSRKSLSLKTNIHESKIERILKYLEIEQQIEQQNFFSMRLITIVRWIDYQKSEQQSEQPVNSQRTASEQPVNTNKNDNNDKNDKNDKNKYNMVLFFEKIWSQYPKPQGKKNALRHFLATVKTEVDKESLQTALDNYKLSSRVERGYIQNGSTWFNQWQDWISPTPDMIGKEKEPNMSSIYDFVRETNNKMGANYE